MTSTASYVGEPDRAGDWKPSVPIAQPPLFVWPPRPKALAKFLFGVPGYFLPWNILYLALAVITWLFLTPALASMKTFQLDWISIILARNLGLLFLVCGAWHFRFYIRRAQDGRFMFNRRPPQARHRRFLFGDQVRDNMFWSAVSGIGILTTYEVLTLWALANGYIPYLNWEEHPVYFVLFFCVLPLYRDAHFYFIHRLLHYRFLYRTVHYLHHKNVDIGPWTGIAMHPVEHAIFFSSLALHWVVASHPLLIVWHVQNLVLSPAMGHLGYDAIEMRNGTRISLGQRYYHYLHHKHFECNYGGDGTVPLDKWFGSFHDGTPQSHAAMTERRRQIRREA